MSLEMRERCGTCGLSLAPEGAAFICSYECTYCPTCAEDSPRCPNCNGELAPRPRRRRHERAEPVSGSLLPAEVREAPGAFTLKW